MLISEYFQKIESQIADCIYIIETSLVKDKGSLNVRRTLVLLKVSFSSQMNPGFIS